MLCPTSIGSFGPGRDSCTATKSGDFRNWLSGVQPIEQGLGLLQVERVETFGEAVVDGCQKVVSFRGSPLIGPKFGERGGGSQFPELRLLLLCESDGRFEALFRLNRALFWLDEQHLSLEAKQFWFVPTLTRGQCSVERGLEKGKRAIRVARSDLGQSDNSDSDRQVEATRGKRLQSLQSGFSLVDTSFDVALKHEDPTLHDFGRYKVVRQRVLLGKWNANVQMRFGLF
jgi:hypothetical protein